MGLPHQARRCHRSGDGARSTARRFGWSRSVPQHATSDQLADLAVGPRNASLTCAGNDRRVRSATTATRNETQHLGAHGATGVGQLGTGTDKAAIAANGSAGHLNLQTLRVRQAALPGRACLIRPWGATTTATAGLRPPLSAFRSISTRSAARLCRHGPVGQFVQRVHEQHFAQVRTHDREHVVSPPFDLSHQSGAVSPRRFRPRT